MWCTQFSIDLCLSGRVVATTVSWVMSVGVVVVLVVIVVVVVLMVIEILTIGRKRNIDS